MLDCCECYVAWDSWESVCAYSECSDSPWYWPRGPNMAFQGSHASGPEEEGKAHTREACSEYPLSVRLWACPSDCPAPLCGTGKHHTTYSCYLFNVCTMPLYWALRQGFVFMYLVVETRGGTVVRLLCCTH